MTPSSSAASAGLSLPPNPEQKEGLGELNFKTSESLDLVEQRLRAADVTVVQSVTDEGFGRQLKLSAPVTDAATREPVLAVIIEPQPRRRNHRSRKSSECV